MSKRDVWEIVFLVMVMASMFSVGYSSEKSTAKKIATSCDRVGEVVMDGQKYECKAVKQ